MYNLRTSGRFVSRKQYALHALLAALKVVYREAKKVDWTRRIALGFTIGVVCAIMIDVSIQNKVLENSITYAQAEEIEVEVPVMIELAYTKERVKELIAEEFGDAPIMMKVAACESGFLQHAYNPTNNSHDGGVFQISEKYHGNRMEKLGLDPYDVKDNIKYARILYDESGLAPWSASKPCWK